MYANINAKVSRLASQVGQLSIQKGGGIQSSQAIIIL